MNMAELEIPHVKSRHAQCRIPGVGIQALKVSVVIVNVSKGSRVHRDVVPMVCAVYDLQKRHGYRGIRWPGIQEHALDWTCADQLRLTDLLA